MKTKLLICLILTFVSICKCIEDQFTEELFIKDLDNGYVSANFQFTTNLKHNIFKEEISSHYNLFPKSLGEIISKFEIAELHLTFTQGRWRYNKWGYPTFSAPTGVELWVWFQPQLKKTSVDENWKGLVHALSGQFCSSLNFITKAFTVHPKDSFKPLGVWPHEADSENHLRYATLSRETVCTENLSPWKKLLPCIGKAGLSTLLNPLRLFDSSYHSLAVHLRSVCQDNDCLDTSLELKQTITSVFNAGNYNQKHGWSLKSLFNKDLASACPLASSSKIIVDLNNMNESSLSPEPDSIEVKQNSKKYAVYNLLNKEFKKSFDIATNIVMIKRDVSPPCITSHKYTTGYGGEKGGTVCKITNNHPTQDINITYLDVVPYFLRTYLHTLKVHVDNQRIKPVLTYVPAYYRERPASIEIRFSLPSLTTASIAIEFEKVFMDWMQHPPDSHHGYYIGSSVISGMLPTNDMNQHSLNEQCPTVISHNDTFCTTVTSSNEIFRRIYTETLLIPVPLPDFSMPYNVICLTCTVVAIAFGSIYNITTRTFQVEPEKEKTTVKEKVLNFLSKFTKKKKKLS